MKLLKIIEEKDVFLGRLGKQVDSYFERDSVRAVIVDDQNKIALIHVTNNNYYKLPGGGVDKEETIEEALKRESLEEVGCDVSILEEIGEIIEYRQGDFNMKQKSFCYLVRIVGEKGNPHFEPDEIRDGFEVIWVKPNEAIDLLKNSKPDCYDGKFNVVRDLEIMGKVKILN